jgi:hypothetical protein
MMYFYNVYVFISVTGVSVCHDTDVKRTVVTVSGDVASEPGDQ